MYKKGPSWDGTSHCLSESAYVCPSTCNPIGSYIQMYSSRFAFVNANTKSIAFESRLCILDIARMRRAVRMLTTGG